MPLRKDDHEPHDAREQPVSLRSFQHIAPPLRLFSGPDSLGQIGRELDRANSRRAVVFCGATLAREGTLLGLVQAAMGDRCAGVFAGVRAHSPVASIETAARELKRLGADAVVAVGGGSAIVTARAASIVLAEQASVASLSTTLDEMGRIHSPRLLSPKLPQLVLPTTPTTAIVKAGSAVFDPASGRRLALYDPKTRAHSVFIHPGLIASAPSPLVTTASLNIFTLAIEGLMSRTGDPLADALLMHALRLVRRHLPANSVDNDLEARGELVMAAILCGQGTDHTGAGVTTVLSHAIGARHGLENGTLNAILLPHVLRFNAQASPGGVLKIASSLDMPGLDAGAAALGIGDTVSDFVLALGMPSRLSDVGVPREDLAEIATLGMADWFLRDNPRPIHDASELLQLLEDAW
jgi:alcohol dehydrogenase class IV